MHAQTQAYVHTHNQEHTHTCTSGLHSNLSVFCEDETLVVTDLAEVISEQTSKDKSSFDLSSYSSTHTHMYTHKQPVT